MAFAGPRRALLTQGFLPQSVALFARFTTPPTPSRKIIINNYIKALISSGVWQKFDALYVMAAADSQAARRNWVQDAFNLTGISSPTFSTDLGYSGNGTTSYLTTNFSPSTNGVQYLLNSAHLSAYNRTSRTSNANTALIGANGVGAIVFTASNIFPKASGNLIGELNANGGSGTNANAQGFYVVRRSASNAVAVFKNNTKSYTTSVVSVGRPAYDIFILAENSPSGALYKSTDQIAMASIGASLTDQEISAFTSATEAYMDALGAGIIP